MINYALSIVKNCFDSFISDTRVSYQVGLKLT